MLRIIVLKLLLSLAFCWTIVIAKGQQKDNKIEVDVRGNYYPPITGTRFPTHIKNLGRTELTPCNEEKSDIACTYETESKRTRLTVYVYPITPSINSLLRYEFRMAYRVMALYMNNPESISKQPCYYIRDGYKVNGYSALIKSNNHKWNSLALYQCGKWFVNIRITTDAMDSSDIILLNNATLDAIDPFSLVDLSGPKPQFGVTVAKIALRDSLLLNCAASSSLSKFDWVSKNIDTLELLSGFPDLYFDLHIAGINGFLDFADKHPNMSTTPFTSNYIKELRTIKDKGFLNEFVYDQFEGVLLVPVNIQLKNTEYQYWKANHPMDIDLNDAFYFIYSK